MPAPSSHPNDPLHGVTLEKILRELQDRYGWKEMGREIPIQCFRNNPSISSSLKFLRKTPWARERLEQWYIDDLPRTDPG
ncbi:MAG: DUF2132 domain-containing protein [Akkermansiaceae bacterium]|nr:DUF2132 domain-containing protein [Akkermansiaceae bacterium]NNM28041.1 DUF2132 domain-containing protein [Akkermansiaceae bacterium]